MSSPAYKHQCTTEFVLAINDTMNVLKGKWKLTIIGSLIVSPKRFKELERDIPKITSRMLSKELKDLEMNGIVVRKVFDQTPVLIEYHLTESGKSFKTVLESMIDWGLKHRNLSIHKLKKENKS